jgi:hypothetical protein
MLEKASSKKKKTLNAVQKQFIKQKQNNLSFEEDNEELEPVLTFDIETHDWINFVVLGFYDLSRDHYIYFDDLFESIEYMYNYCKERGIKNIFGHFAGKFDFNFILNGMYNFSEHYHMTKAIPRGTGFLSMQITKIINEEDAENDFKLTFYDSAALFPMGLGNLADMMKVETQKGSVDFKYLQKAWNGESYKEELLKATYVNEFNVETTRHKVFIKDKETKSEKLISLSNDSDISYFCNDDKKTYVLYRKENILDYLKDDCVALAQSIEKFYEFDFIKKAKKAKTIAGQAVNVLKTYIPEGLVIPKSKVAEDEFVRQGYFGGRTEVFKHFFSNKYDIKENNLKFSKLTLDELRKQKGHTLKCYDVNSLYPTQMLKIFPLHCVGIVKGEKSYEKYQWGMWKVTVRIPLTDHIPFLGIQHTTENGSSKLCFTVGEITGYWTKEELEYSKTIGYEIVKYHEGCVYTSADYIFKPFIEDMYSRRLKAKNEKDEATSGVVKLIMNSCYGKIGMRTDDKVFLRETKYIDFYKDRRYVNSIHCGKKEIHFEEVDSDTRNIFHKVIIPAYVTAYARVHMHKLMVECGYENIYYTDTDSIFTTIELPTGDGLGELKLEYECNESVFLMPKTYSIDDILNSKYSSKIVMKGFDRRKISSFTHQEVVKYKFLEAQSLKAFDPAKFLTMGSAFQKGTFLGMARSIEDATKRFYEQRKLINLQISDAERLGDFLLTKKLNIKINKITELYNKQKPVNYKEIKSKYDKRIPHADQINTTPIILGVINGQFQSDIKQKRKPKSISKSGIEFA